MVALCGGEVFTLVPKRVSTLNVSGTFTLGAPRVILDAGCLAAGEMCISVEGSMENR